MTHVRNVEDAPRGSITPCQNTTSSDRPLLTENSDLGVVFFDSTQNTSAVSPVTVDGGTRFVLHLAKKFRPVDEWKAILLSCETGATRREVPLPVSDDLAPLDAAPSADLVVSGAKRHILTFLVPDLVWFRFNTDSRDLHVQLKAKGLWAFGAGAEGYALMAGYWLRELYRLFAGEVRGDVFRAGWKLTGLELCRDFTGLQFVRSDAGAFIGAKTNGDEGRELVRVWGNEGQAVETINIGRRTSNHSLCIYDKITQVEDVKGGDASTYEAAWRAHGWEDERIVRVEMRFSARGLSWEDRTTGETLDFTDPSTAAFQHNLNTLWELACYKRRLVQLGTSSRKERCKIDPRWLVVSEVGAGAAHEGWRQTRQVQRDTHRVRIENARRDGLRAVARYGALHKAVFGPVGKPGIARELITDMLEGYNDDLLREYQDKYLRQSQPILADEMDQAMWELSERVDRRLKGGGRKR